MQRRSVIAGLLLLWCARARAAEPSARLSLVAGPGWRDVRARAPENELHAMGGALSELAVEGAWFGRHLGLVAEAQAARFALVAERGALGTKLDVTGGEALAALAVRARGGPLTIEGRAGYGVIRWPVPRLYPGPAGDVRFTSLALLSHGPVLGARLRLALGARLAIELDGLGAPVGFGASYAGTATIPRRIDTRGLVAIEGFRTGRVRWAALVNYGFAYTSATGAGLALHERRHLLGLGLRATWADAPVLPPPPPPPTRIVVAPVPPAPAPSLIGGVVRAQSGQAVMARVSIPELDLVALTDASFRFEVPPGHYTLVIEAPGWLPQRKPISAGPGEQRIYNIELQRERQ